MHNKHKNFICRHPYTMMELHPDGNVYPCCPAWCNEYSFGNVFELGSTFDSVWNSQKARDFRKSIVNGEYEYCNLEMCQGTSSLSDGKGSALVTPAPDGMSPYPTYVKYCHDLHCNLRCITCRDVHIVNSAEKTRELDALIDTHLLPALKNAKTVSLNGSGEVFASAHCRRLVKEIADKYGDIRFAIHTNGVLCDEKNCTDLGIIDRLESVQVSISAINRKTYDRINRGGNYDKVWQNVTWLSHLKKTDKLNDLRLVFVVSAMNYKEMKPFLKKAITLGATVDFWEYRPWGSSMAREFEKMAIFSPEHKKYRSFSWMLKDEIFKSPYCCMDLVLRNVADDYAQGRQPLFGIRRKKDRDVLHFLGIRIKLPKRRILENIKFTYQYYYDFLKEIDELYGFKGKNVYEIGADSDLECARAALLCGAKAVWACNPKLVPEKSPYKKIFVKKEVMEDSKFEDNKFDLVYGFALLEHVLNPSNFARELARIMKKGGHAYLTGWPMWSGAEGHHAWADLSRSYRFNDPGDIFESWYHLSNPSEEEYTDFMVKKNVPVNDIKILYNFAHVHPHISRLSTTEVFDAFNNTKVLKVEMKRFFTNEEPNIWYEKARGKYSDEDLKTLGICMYITKVE